MAHLRRYLVFATSLAAALVVGFLMQQTVPDNHPGLAGVRSDSPAAGEENAAFRLHSLPDSAVTALSAEVDPVPDLSPPLPRTAEVTVPQADVMPPLLQPGLAPPDVGAAPLPDPSARLASLDQPPMPPASDPIVIELAMPGTLERLAPVGTPVAPADTAVAECTRDLALTTEAPALLRVTVAAPCDENARVIVRHAGLVVTQRLSVYGSLDIALPAFAANGAIEVAFLDGETLSAAIEVPDLDRYQRVGVQWQAPDSFQLHAYEHGATHNAGGHVSAASPRDAAHAVRETGGFLQLLGDSRADWPLLAEVYTFPAGRLSAAGRVRIEVEAMITEDVCGNEMLAETLELRTDGVVRVRELFIEMPDCEAVGGYIVLQNVLDDLKVANN